VVDAIARAEAVKSVRDMPEFQAIGAASKRMRNILRQAQEKGIQPATKFEASSDAAKEEKELSSFIEKNRERMEAHRAAKEYSRALFLLSGVREHVDRFFDKVMVMVDDARLRANRLALLSELVREFSTIADFSEIVTEGKD
jgi:glycyl-tRNA synthetase beta chain